MLHLFRFSVANTAENVALSALAGTRVSASTWYHIQGLSYEERRQMSKTRIYKPVCVSSVWGYILVEEMRMCGLVCFLSSAVTEAGKAGESLAEDFFREEYILNNAIGKCLQSHYENRKAFTFRCVFVIFTQFLFCLLRSLQETIYRSYWWNNNGRSEYIYFKCIVHIRSGYPYFFFNNSSFNYYLGCTISKKAQTDVKSSFNQQSKRLVILYQKWQTFQKQKPANVWHFHLN